MVLLSILLIALCVAASFFATAGLVWVVCWAFTLAWSWKLAIGVWAVICLVSSAVKTTIHTNK